MSLTHNKITLNSSTATMLSDSPSEKDFYARSYSISVQNLHSSHFVFVGDNSVTTSNYGFRIAPGDTFALQEVSVSDDLYAVTDSGSTDVAVIKVVG
jgi:hypothetical protein